MKSGMHRRYHCHLLCALPGEELSVLSFSKAPVDLHWQFTLKACFSAPPCRDPLSSFIVVFQPSFFYRYGNRGSAHLNVSDAVTNNHQRWQPKTRPLLPGWALSEPQQAHMEKAQQLAGLPPWGTTHVDFSQDALFLGPR